MSQAFKCDRCKNLSEGHPRGTVELTQTDEDYGTHVTLDLCSRCFTQVHTAIEKPVSS